MTEIWQKQKLITKYQQLKSKQKTKDSVNYRAVDLPILPGTTLEHPCLAPVAAFAHCAAGVQPRQNWKQIGPSLIPLSCYPCPFPQSVRSFLPFPSAASAVVGRKEAVVADMRRV